MVSLCQRFNCSSHEQKHPAHPSMPTAVHCAILWSISATWSNGRCLGFFTFFTLLPVLPWQQLGNAHFRANGQLLVSYQGEACGHVLSIEKNDCSAYSNYGFSERVMHADSTACLNSTFP